MAIPGRKRRLFSFLMSISSPTVMLGQPNVGLGLLKTKKKHLSSPKVSIAERKLQRCGQKAIEIIFDFYLELPHVTLSDRLHFTSDTDMLYHASD